MNLHTKEFLMDILTLILKIFITLLITYLVFWKGISGWWYLILFTVTFEFKPSEYIDNKKNK